MGQPGWGNPLGVWTRPPALYSPWRELWACQRGIVSERGTSVLSGVPPPVNLTLTSDPRPNPAAARHDTHAPATAAEASSASSCPRVSNHMSVAFIQSAVISCIAHATFSTCRPNPKRNPPARAPLLGRLVRHHTHVIERGELQADGAVG